MKLKDEFVYNPSIDYYFLSVRYVGDCPKWIRKPFQTKKEVNQFLITYFASIDDFKDLQILNEKLLRDKVCVKNKVGELVETDLRTWLFDDRYSSQSDYYQKIINSERGFSWKEGFNEWAEENGFNETA